MRRIYLSLGVSVVLAFGTGCSLAMRPVQMEATHADWEKLAGDWRGDYSIPGRARHGVIEFRLNAPEQQATGDVLMIADRFKWPETGMPPRDGFTHLPATESQLLTIRFVAAVHGQIQGSMDPYWDPDRGCRAFATFAGSVDGDVIAGSFTSVCEDGARVLKGRWRVERRLERR
jgi:hypothetical protein